MLVNPFVIANLLLESLLFALAFVAFVVSLQVLLWWDFSKNDTLQYRLQKRIYLVSTIAKYILSLKIALFLFFIYTLDHLSLVLHGAMCAVGVVDASSYGKPLLFLKIINLYLFAFWIVLNEEDYRHAELPYTKLKSFLFLTVYLLFGIELFLEYSYFADIDPMSLVSCCGAVFSKSGETVLAALLQLPNSLLYGSFYVLFLMLAGAFVFRLYAFYAALSALFIPVALFTLIGYFGTYIYELPTHHCPFCLLQKEYGYIGYILYTVLFLGTFYGMLSGFFRKQNYLKRSFSFLLIYTLLVSFYPLWYYMQNGKWLY